MSTLASVFESAAVVEIEDQCFHHSKENVMVREVENDGLFDFVQTDIMYCTRPTDFPVQFHVLDIPSLFGQALLYTKCLFAIFAMGSKPS